MPTMNPRDEVSTEVGCPQEGERAKPLASGPMRRKVITGGLSAGPVLMAFQSKSALAFHVCQSPSGAMSGNLSHGNQLPDVACMGSSPDVWNDFTAGNPSRPAWPGTFAEPALQIRLSNVTGNGYSHWGNVTGSITGALNLADFTWSGENVLQGKLRVRRVDSSSSPEFGASFQEVIGSATGILVPVLPTPPSANSDQKKAGTVELGRPVSVLEVLYWPSQVSSGNPLLGQLAQYCVAAYFNALVNDNYALMAEQAQHIWYDIAVSGAGYCPLGDGQCSPSWGAQEAIDYLASTFA